MKETRTLRISDFCMATVGDDPVTVTYERLWRHFNMWGELEDIKLVPIKAVAFIKYSHRCMAEFAKEAMRYQALDNNEILTVKWAESDVLDSEDPDEKDKLPQQNLDKSKFEKPKGKGKFGKRGKRDPKDEDSGDDLLLGKRDDGDTNYDAEYGIIQQRINQIEKNVGVMDRVFKKVKPGEEVYGAFGRLQDQQDAEAEGSGMDDFFKNYKSNKPDDPMLNNRPLF